MGSWLERPGKVCAAPYLLICGRLAPGTETEQGLERGHGLPAPIVAKDEFIKINLKLIGAHAVIWGTSPGFEEAYPLSLRHLQTPSFAIPICKVNPSEKVCEKLIQLIEIFSEMRFGMLRAARRTR